MASWELTCKNCGDRFSHSKIEETLADYFLPKKPEFPAKGQEIKCPSCKTTGTYQRSDLRYQFE
jgi:DNA-directed RNA polymerase subunit RPC12/RpoP